MEALGLYQLNNMVKQVFKKSFPELLLVVAEIADIKENRSGHCYLELVEKKENEDTIIAMARATIWAFTYRMLKPYFETTTGKVLQKGMKVLLQVEVVFHEVYGYSLNVKDIDPTFTIGDLERKRKEILERLEREGVIHMNRSLELAIIPKVIAVISSPSAAGYGDFLDQLHHNPYGYVFHTCLFPAVMQGEKTAESVVAALERVYACEGMFDAVVIIRGGGSQVDLGSFDSYELAAHVAQFPLPVIVGIGPERDETIVDRVAFQRVKTPTAAAAFLVDQVHDVDLFLEEMQRKLLVNVNRILQKEKRDQQMLCVTFKKQIDLFLEKEQGNLNLLSGKLAYFARRVIQVQQGFFEHRQAKLEGKVKLRLGYLQYLLAERQRMLIQGVKSFILAKINQLEMAETKMRFVDPNNILKRGFSITRFQGRVLRYGEQLPEGASIETELWNGHIKSIVEKIEFRQDGEENRL